VRSLDLIRLLDDPSPEWGRRAARRRTLTPAERAWAARSPVRRPDGWPHAQRPAV